LIGAGRLVERYYTTDLVGAIPTVTRPPTIAGVGAITTVGLEVICRRAAADGAEASFHRPGWGIPCLYDKGLNRSFHTKVFLNE
jgi:hypothetical protein